ncbi:hypothetical protein [Bailinhaonella thermotolerans]|uniref:DUF3558 domain-containing protein n=1 Tax=Bailinhaonella thermotolerans TaxID=1070861 RepID=A0A3A4BR00_9ACTN|nr:hypothetical protein [Bailinhaonella thermotolerans]RJL33566.1 hypothetical protein D5H75_12455 [Bailinhaonella thermotolerans]
MTDGPPDRARNPYLAEPGESPYRPGPYEDGVGQGPRTARRRWPGPVAAGLGLVVAAGVLYGVARATGPEPPQGTTGATSPAKEPVFTRLPAPCGLVSAETAGDLVPGAEPESVPAKTTMPGHAYASCRWRSPYRHDSAVQRERDIAVRVELFSGVSRAGADDASRLFRSERDRCRRNQHTTDRAGFAYRACEDLPAIAPQAFTAYYTMTTATSRLGLTETAFRAGNVLVFIEYKGTDLPADVPIPEPHARRAAERLAQETSRNLRP